METNPTQNNGNEELNKNPTENVQSLRTYKSDVAEFIKREGKTLADIAIAENSRRSDNLRAEKSLPEKRKKALLIIIVTTSLIVISTLVFWFILKPKQEIAPVTTTGEIVPSMFLTGIKEKNIPIGKQNESGTLNIINTALKESAPFLVLRLTTEKNSLETTALTTRDFLDKVGIYPPSDLIRSLTDNFSVGSIGGKARFLVLKNNYYGGAFAGMLAWEDTMIADLQNLLDLSVVKNSNITTTSVGTTTFLSQIKPSKFEDDVIANRDARIFKNGSGSIILIYLFPDNNTIVITSSESAAKIVVEKLLRTKVK